jgi:carbamoyl-phosphate synthase small subunit
MEGTRDGRTANLSKEPVDAQHPAEAQQNGAPQNQAAEPNTTDNKTEDKK